MTAIVQQALARYSNKYLSPFGSVEGVGGINEPIPVVDPTGRCNCGRLKMAKTGALLALLGSSPGCPFLIRCGSSNRATPGRFVTKVLGPYSIGLGLRVRPFR